MNNPERARGRRHGPSWVASVSALALCCASANAATADIVLDVQHTPSPLPTTAGNVLVYELNVRNRDASNCARLVDVRVTDASGASTIEQRYQASAIAANVLLYDSSMTPLPNPVRRVLHPADIPPGGGAVVYFFVALAQGTAAPAMLRHTLGFKECEKDWRDTKSQQTVIADFPVSNAPPVVVGLPFRGAGWVAGDAVNAKGTHRRTLIPVRDANGAPLVGQYHVPERFAIDWIMVDDESRRAVGAVDDNASYLAFGREIIAVTDGVISRTRDGMPEQTPQKPPNAPTVEMAAGNYVMEDSGGGHYAFYAHLQPGSLRVTDGQHVTRGQVIALLGNTGNSTEPHLHFHISDANDPLMSEGVPFVFDQFRTTGQVDGMDEASGLFLDYARQDPQPHDALMPGSFSVIDDVAQPPKTP